MKKQKIILGIVIVIIILGGGIFVLSRGKSAKPESILQQQEEVIPTIAPESLGLSLKMGDDGKRVIMEISNTDDISSVDYTLSYMSKGNIPRGAIGHVDNKSKGKPIKKEIVLGTCSDVCHYDQDVSSIKLVLKITKTDGKVYQAEKSLD